MRFIDKIKKKLTEEEFSFELLNYCKDEFQHGGFDENDKAEFIFSSELFIGEEKIKI